MSGKKVLDLAALLRVSKAVAAKNIALQRQYLNHYNKTSSLAKAVKDQADKVTQTIQAASALAQRLDIDPRQESAQSPQSSNETSIPSKESVTGSPSSIPRKEGINQDHFYERSEKNSSGQPLAEESLDIIQKSADRSPLPDGTISPSGSHIYGGEGGQDIFSEVPPISPAKKPSKDNIRGEGLEPKSSNASSVSIPAKGEVELDPEKARGLQRQYGTQITSHTAEPSSAEQKSMPEAENGHDQDVYYSPSTDSRPVLSSLPRAKVPRNTTSSQVSDGQIAKGQINQKVFYSRPEGKGPDTPAKQAAPEKQQVSEDIYSELFHSPKIATMLQGKPSGRSAWHEIKSRHQHKATSEKTKLSVETDDDTINTRKGEVGGSGTGLQKEQSRRGPASSTQEDVAAQSDNEPQIAQKVAQAPLQPYQMHESRVPASRIGRLWQYGGLATSMALGAVGESFRRATGSGGDDGGSLMLNGPNMERLVAKLSKMRGAALKLGQMMSFQDSKMLPAPIHQVLQRVQDSADYMPASQRDKVLSSNLGSDWRGLFSSFEEIPMAAASIGQVHGAVLKSTGMPVAIKVQYPGVSTSIDSDLNNLSVLLTASRLLPRGLYLDKTIANARTELAWECDYVREAEAAKRFASLLADETDTFAVPAIIDEASSSQVLTMERMYGTGVTKVLNYTQDQKDWVGTQILRLCLREIAEFRFMQTDPNWTNFLFNDKTGKLELLDFGASRDFPKEFITPYLAVLRAASRNDKNSTRELSIQLGYLTGQESRAMLDAHIASIFTLAEPFASSAPETYDFRDQTITDRVRALIPVMIRERLAPPPEETYSLHRKLSGAFLLCARLGSRVRAKEMFSTAMDTAAIP